MMSAILDMWEGATILWQFIKTDQDVAEVVPLPHVELFAGLLTLRNELNKAGKKGYIKGVQFMLLTSNSFARSRITSQNGSGFVSRCSKKKEWQSVSYKNKQFYYWLDGKRILLVGTFYFMYVK